MKRIKFVGLDVHAGTIAVAVAEQNGEVSSLGVIPNREDSVRKPEFTNLYRSAQNGEFTLQDFHENAMRRDIDEIRHRRGALYGEGRLLDTGGNYFGFEYGVY